MYQSMRRHSLAAVLPRLLLALVLAVVLLAFTAGSAFRLMAGPDPLNVLGTQAAAGDYVSVDMSQIVTGYASLTNEKSDGSTNTIKTFYILKIGEGTYLSLCADGRYDKSLERATDQAYDYYRNNSGILNEMGLISGQLTAMDDESLEMLTSWITQSKLEGFETEGAYTGTILPLEMQLNRIGSLSVTWTWILFALGLACLIWFVVELSLALSGFYFRQVRQALGNDANAIAEWQSAEAFGNARVGKDYIWYTRGPKSFVFPFNEVVWVYKQFDPRVLGRYKWPVSIFTSSRDYHELCVQEDRQREQLIQILRAHGGKFVAGYSQDNYDQFCNDFQAFCDRAAAGDPDADAPVVKLPD